MVLEAVKFFLTSAYMEHQNDETGAIRINKLRSKNIKNDKALSKFFLSSFHLNFVK